MVKRIALLLCAAFLFIAANAFADTISDKQAALAGLVFGFFIITILCILFYIYSALCLQFIAKKTNREPTWLAWIPIANLFLMCKIASIAYWWLLLLLLAFIPIIGFLVTIGFFGFLWYKIALTRNKPGWLGALSIIPIANLVIMGYLAFSD